MSRPAACLAVSLLLAATADAAWSPVFGPSYIHVRPGETVTTTGRGAWLSGIMFVPFAPMTFVAEDPSIAVVEGHLPTSAATPVRVTGLRPGVTHMRVLEHGGLPATITFAVIVVSDQELPVAIRVNGVIALGHPITLSAVSDEPDATFTWYHGRMGGVYTWRVGAGREFTFTPNVSAHFEYWVLMTTPRGAGASGVTVQVVHALSLRRRAVRQ